MIRSCGGGSVCHALSASDRMGAPAGLDYDLRPASLTIEIETEDLARLEADQLRLLAERRSIAGLFGPDALPHPTTAPAVEYERVAADGATFAPLPAVDSAEGFELFRNWLACGVPVVERTLAMTSPVAGFTDSIRFADGSSLLSLPYQVPALMASRPRLSKIFFIVLLSGNALMTGLATRYQLC